MGNTRAPFPGTSTTSVRQLGIRVVLVLLISEKVIQHVAVTVALLVDLRGIRASLALDYRFFLVAGACEALLFVCAGWGVVQKTSWTWWLLFILALMDVVGEFVAQGTLMVTLNVSLVVAAILLAVSLIYRQTTRQRLNADAAR